MKWGFQVDPTCVPWQVSNGTKSFLWMEGRTRCCLGRASRNVLSSECDDDMGTYFREIYDLDNELDRYFNYVRGGTGDMVIIVRPHIVPFGFYVLYVKRKSGG